MSFVAAAFLAGLVTLAFPWWLHRRRSHSPDARRVASLQLMRASATPVHRHRVLRHRALLGCRWLLLTVLVLAFAQPVLEGGAGVKTVSRTLPRLIVIDTSLSMGAHVDHARDTAARLLDELPPGVPAAVVAAAGELTLLAPMQDDRAALQAAVANVDAGAERLSFDGLLGRVAGLAGSLSLEPLEIHLVSDFQASAMPQQFNALLMPVDYPVVLHPLRGATDNWQLASVTVADQVDVRVRSFAGTARQVTVVLTVNGGEAGRQRLDVAPRSEATATFTLPSGFEAGGALVAHLDSADAMPGDDTHHAVVNARQPIQVPLFVGAGAAPQAAYLRTAVDAAAAPFQPASADVRARLAVVVDPGELDATSQRRLVDHVDQGGSLLIIAGPGTQRAGRLPVTSLAVTAGHLARDASGVAVRDPSHPALGGAAGWRDVRVFRHVSAEVQDAHAVLLATDDGTALLLELPLPAGRALLLTTALDPQWSTLVASPVFVRFVADALAYLAEELVPDRAVAGQRVMMPAASLQVFDSHGARQLALQDTVGRAGIWLARPGVYTLRTPDRSRLLAVNADPRESDPPPASAELLDRWQAAVRGAPARAVATAASPAVLPVAPWLLAFLLMLAALEPVAANLTRREPAA